MYGVGSLAIVVVGLCVFYTFKKPTQAVQQAVQQAEDKQHEKDSPNFMTTNNVIQPYNKDE